MAGMALPSLVFFLPKGIISTAFDSQRYSGIGCRLLLVLGKFHQLVSLSLAGYGRRIEHEDQQGIWNI